MPNFHVDDVIKLCTVWPTVSLECIDVVGCFGRVSSWKVLLLKSQLLLNSSQTLSRGTPSIFNLVLVQFMFDLGL